MAEVPLPDGEVREAELKLAKQLIDQIASETFEPTKYHDDVRERIHADIERKVQGQDISESAPGAASRRGSSISWTPSRPASARRRGASAESGAGEAGGRS